MKKTSFSALAVFAALLIGPVHLRAQETRAAGRGSDGAPRGPEGFGRGVLGLESLTAEEREKLRAVYPRVLQNEKVRAAEVAMQEAARNLRNAREEAMASLASEDASLEPIVRKLKEAGVREAEGSRRRGEGEGPRRGREDTPVSRPPADPKGAGPQPKRPDGERPPGPRPEGRGDGLRAGRAEGDRPVRGEGDRPGRGEGDRPARSEGRPAGATEEGARPQNR
jgi:hypothetical protein